MLLFWRAPSKWKLLFFLFDTVLMEKFFL